MTDHTMHKSHDMTDNIELPVRASSTAYEIEPRKVAFDFSNTPLHWIPNDPFSSHFINLLHIILPAGEFWFCRVYNKAVPRITDEKLAGDVKAFLRQESMHARAHDAAVKNYLHSHGLDTDPFTRKMDWLFKEFMGEDRIFGLIKVPAGSRRERWWLKFRLGIIAAIEHFTCVLGSYVLNNKTWDHDGADPVMLDILRWHGAEEVEHRCVAYDLYRHMGGSYAHRFGLMAIVVPMLVLLWVVGATLMMRQDPALQKFKPRIWKPWVWREWKRVANTTAHLPRLGWVVSESMSYLKPGYHPVYEADTEQALDYLRHSPAAQTVSAGH